LALQKLNELKAAGIDKNSTMKQKVSTAANAGITILQQLMAGQHCTVHKKY